MQTASKRLAVPYDARDATDPRIAELQSLFKHVHVATSAINAAMACERASSSAEAEADVLVLDDVTLR